jgi:hypothetical protein
VQFVETLPECPGCRLATKVKDRIDTSVETIERLPRRLGRKLATKVKAFNSWRFMEVYGDAAIKRWGSDERRFACPQC